MSKELAAEVAAPESAGEGVAASLGLNAQLFAFQLVNFLLVGAVLWFLILRPLVKKMEERRLLINDSLDKAKEAETALAMSEVKFQERIDDAKMQANKLIERAQGDAEALAADMKVKAKREIQLLVDQAKRNIQIERDDAMTAVRAESAAMIISALKKMLGENFDEKKDRKWMDDALKNL